MRYNKIVRGEFVDRPNRFIAHVKIDGIIETVHVKNTGRCKELLIPGVEVILEDCDNPNRKTRYDLIMVYKKGFGWINMDSQAPNKVVNEYLNSLDYDYVKPEYTYGDSRVDFYMERGDKKYLYEVKGCTLEVEGVGYFPDAPTTRGVKHLKELTKAVAAGYECAICFVIQMEGIDKVLPNGRTDPDFEQAYNDAIRAGVKVIYYCCKVGQDNLVVDHVIEL